MKHTNIARILGITEVEDLEEGYHLQPEEALAVDTFIGTVSNAQEALIVAEATAAAHLQTIEGLVAEASNATTLTTAAAEKIAALEAEIVVLGGKASGNGTVITATADENTTDKAVPSYLDDSNPINQYADKHARKK